MKWALLMTLAGCAASPVAAPAVPADLQACAGSVPVPLALPRVRTVDQLGAYATRLELAREAERRRGDDCAERLARLNVWVGK